MIVALTLLVALLMASFNPVRVSLVSSSTMVTGSSSPIVILKLPVPTTSSGAANPWEAR